MNEQDISVAGLVTVLLLLGIYFFPALIAWARDVPLMSGPA